VANLLKTGSAWLAGKLASHAAETVTYRRGGASVSLVAVKTTVRRLQDQDYGILDITECDWLIRATSLVLSGATATPQRDDVIEQSGGQRWHVLPADAEPCARPSDQFGYTWRIHTKRIEAPS